MPGERIKISGCEFDTHLLQPFGERWQPTEEGIFVDEWIQRDIATVVKEVKRRKMIVLGNMPLSQPKNWASIPADPSSEIAHLDSINEDIFVHMLHGNCNDREPTSYTTNEYLSVAAKANLDMLKNLVNEAPENIKTQFGLDLFLEDFSRTDKHIYPRSFLTIFNPLEMMKSKLEQYQSIIMGHTYIVGQSKKQASLDYDALFPVYKKLLAFYLKVAKEAEKYTHNWQQNPYSTVLSNHDNRRIFSDDGLEDLIYHFRESGRVNFRPETFLKRNYIVNGSRTTFKFAYPRV